MQTDDNNKKKQNFVTVSHNTIVVPEPVIRFNS